nr:HPr family phosphocarrier protein [uncultured Sellimonas sp.]
MREFYVKIDSLEKAKTLNGILRRADGDFDLVQDHMTIDGKSFLGILSMDLSRPVKLIIHDSEELEIHRLEEYLA